MNTNYLRTLWEDGYTPDEVAKLFQDNYAKWEQENKDRKIEEARAAMIAAVANYLEALGQTVKQEDIDRTVAALEKLEALNPNDVQVSIGVDADERLRKFLRGIM